MQLAIFSKAVPVMLAGLILSGCASTLPPPKPEAFNFDQVAKEPSAEVKQNLKVDVYGDGTKGAKKFVIGAFQVRFRNDLTGHYAVGASGAGTNFAKSGASVEDTFYLAGSNNALFQKVTDDLYKKFVAALKQRGIQVVGLAAIKQYPEYQKNLKQEMPSGFTEKFQATGISCALCEDAPTGARAGMMTALMVNVSSTEYDVFTPSEVPALEYGLMSANDDLDNVVLPRTLPINRIDAATHAGMGVITVGFEVELIKFDREDQGSRISMSHAPMVRTKLVGFKAFPPGAKMPFSLWGKPVDDGLFVEPKYRGKKRTGVFALANGDVFGKQWIEVDDGSVTADIAGAVKPVADKFPAAFKKSTDAHLHMVMHAFDHQADYK